MKFREETFELDDIDRQLLECLQEDAKVSLNRLGERVGLSAPSVMERVRKLEQAGIIAGYHAILDARAMGLDVAAFIGVRVQSPVAIEAFEMWVEGVAEILECHHVTGSHTLLLKVKARNTAALEHLIRRVRSFEGVASTDTMVVLSTRVERVTIPLGEVGEEPEPKGAIRSGGARLRDPDPRSGGARLRDPDPRSGGAREADPRKRRRAS